MSRPQPLATLRRPAQRIPQPATLRGWIPQPATLRGWIPQPATLRGWIPQPATLRGRLALLALGATAAWVVLLTVGFNLVLAGRLRGRAEDLLRTRAAAVAATVSVRHGGGLVVHEPPPADDRALDTGVWIYQGRRPVARPTVATGASRSATAQLAGRGRMFAQTPEPHAVRLYALPVRSGGRQAGTVVASVSLDPYRSTAEAALAGSAGFALLLLGGVYLVSRRVVGRALRPVEEMSAQAACWSEHGAAERFGAADRPAELASLAANLDELLDRLAAVLRHERRQSAELSHELRTPLARITAETEWLTVRTRSESEQRASREAIASAAATMREICESLLSEARARTGRTPGRCRVGEVARTLARRSAAEHPQAPPVTVPASASSPASASASAFSSASEEDAVCGASAAVVTRILEPLLDNARRYAVRSVRVEWAARTGGVRIAVCDDGPGVPEDVGDAVFEPGHRADPDDGHDGAGLGLALARRLARAAGGDLELAPRGGPESVPAQLPRDAPESGAYGAVFVVTLPAG